MAARILSAARLRELLDFDQESGAFTWKVNRNRVRAGSVAGSMDPYGYLRIGVDRVDYFAHRLVWLYVHGVYPESEIDHINQVKTDNRIANLRLADRSLNNQNRPRGSNNKSGVKGVSWNKANRKWLAHIGFDGQNKYLGSFVTIDEAAAAYAAAVEQHHVRIRHLGA
jgi:hypothetical protein